MKRKFKLFLIGCFLILSTSLFGQDHWIAVPAGSGNTMNVTLNPYINGVKVAEAGYEGAVFCNGIVRAVSKTAVHPVIPGVCTIGFTIDNDKPERMKFKLYDHVNNIELITDYSVIFNLTAPVQGANVDFFYSPFDPTTIAGYSGSMTIKAIIAIDGVTQTRDDLQLAVFSGDNLRGFVRSTYEEGDPYAFCDAVVIEGSVNGDPLTYRLYDPVLGQELIFDPNNFTNYPELPQTFTADAAPLETYPIMNFLSPASPVVEIVGGGKYLTLKDAVNVVQNGQTIRVLDNISQTEAVEFPAGMNLTLDLNGCDVEVSGEGSITVSGNLTLVDNAGGASFTTTESNFIINEDAQLYHTLAGINATAVKSIEQTTDGWDGIASPMTAGSILNIETNGINELYYYDETGSEQNGLEWVAMAETSDNSYTLDEAGRGYLYANSVDPNQPQYESSFFFDFNDGTLNGWTTIDADDDGYCWYNYEGVLNSDSDPKTEDYIVTSDKYTLNEDFVLSFDWELSASRRTTEHLAVVFSTDNVNFGVIYDLEVAANNSAVTDNGTESLDLQSIAEFVSGYEENYADINDYVGQNVYIGFLHNNSTGSYSSLDNIRLTSGTKSARADEGAILNFAGVLNHEDVSYDLTYTDSQLLKGFHLLGNPFAHNINVMNVWNETLANGYYAISNRGEWLARSTDNVAEVIAPMEAFLIKAGQAGKLTIRKNANSNSKRSSSNGSLKLSVTNGELRDDAYVSFNAGIGLDKISHRNENAPMLYIPAQDKNYAVAVMDKEVKEIPLSFEAKQMGQYTISAEALNCEFEELYLIDKQTGTTTNLNLEDYTFIARTGDDEERFVITKSLSGTNPESHDESFIYIDNGDLVVKNIEGEGHVRVFDVLGRPVAEFMAVESARISTERFGNGIYVIQMSDENGVKVQKILID